MSYKITTHRVMGFHIVDADGRRIERHSDPEVAAARLAVLNRVSVDAVTPSHRPAEQDAAAEAVDPFPELSGTAAAAIEATKAGALDAGLSAAIAHEEAGAGRKTVLRALRARQAAQETSG